MENLRNYIAESIDELKNKVTWPTWENLQQTTSVTLIACFILALIIFLMDVFSNQVVGLIYPK